MALILNIKISLSGIPEHHIHPGQWKGRTRPSGSPVCASQRYTLESLGTFWDADSSLHTQPCPIYMLYLQKIKTGSQGRVAFRISSLYLGSEPRDPSMGYQAGRGATSKNTCRASTLCIHFWMTYPLLGPFLHMRGSGLLVFVGILADSLLLLEGVVVVEHDVG